MVKIDNTPEPGSKPESESDYVIVGKIGATYGIQGWVKVHAFTQQPIGILEYDPWYLEDKAGWEAVRRETGRPQGKSIVAKLAGYNSPEQARLLTGKKIAIKRTQLPALPKNEYYWAELEGLTVVDQHGDVLGKVAYLMETGTNDVLVVRGPHKEFAIPYLPGTVVIRIDLPNQVMQVDWDVI